MNNIHGIIGEISAPLNETFGAAEFWAWHREHAAKQAEALARKKAAYDRERKLAWRYSQTNGGQ